MGFFKQSRYYSCVLWPLQQWKSTKFRVLQHLKHSEFRIFGSYESCHNVAQWEQISRKNCKVSETPAQLDSIVSVPDSLKIRIVIRRRRRPFIYNISSPTTRVCHDENFWAKICQQFLFAHRTIIPKSYSRTLSFLQNKNKLQNKKVSKIAFTQKMWFLTHQHQISYSISFYTLWLISEICW